MNTPENSIVLKGHEYQYNKKNLTIEPKILIQK